MTIRNIIAEELALEKKSLAEAVDQAALYPAAVLTYSLDKKGIERYYKCHKSNRKRTYIKRSESEELSKIAYGRLVREKIAALSSNISLLEKVIAEIRDHDQASLIAALPKSYRKAMEHVSPAEPAAQVIQSENPNYREDLVVEVSNGLMVRSKSEMSIAEELIRFGLEFRYEKALRLTKLYVNRDGTAYSENVTVYPDFTIFMPDGTVIYWEHCGMFDKLDYRSANHNKFDLYFDNDIYPPKNLIITMDGPGKPYSSIAVRNIIRGLIENHT
ncbi:MAG: hypothetical protein IKS99_07000 [Firmicutes bacterium]|nr:hypothetical protein [Bacillota bacterium]